MGFIKSFFKFVSDPGNIACDGGGLSGEIAANRARKEFEEKISMAERNSFFDHLTRVSGH